MMLKTQYEFLFVGRDEGSFLENYTYEVQEHRGESGHVFLSLEIQNNPGEAELIGEAMFAELKATFFEENGLEGYLRFEQALKAINRRLHDFRKGKINKHIGSIHAIVAAVEHGSLYVSQSGDSEAYLIRKRFVSIVSEGLSDPRSESVDIFTSIANGELEPGDFVLLATTRLLRYITKTDLSRLVIPSNVPRTLSDIRDTLSSEILGRIGVIGMSMTLITDVPLSREHSSDTDAGQESQSVVSGSVGGSLSRGLESHVKSLTPLMHRVRKYRDLLIQKARESQVFEKTGPVGRFMSQVGYRLSRERGLTKDKILAAFVVVIVLLIGGVWFVRSSQIKNAELLVLDGKLQEARQIVSDAESRGQADKKAAGILLDAAELKAKEVLNTSNYRAKALEILTQIQKTRDLLDNIKHVSDPKIFADLSHKGVTNALGMVLAKGRYYVYEPQKLYEVLLDKVQDPIEFDANDPIISATYFDEKEAPVFFSKSGKIFELTGGTVRPMVAQEGVFRKGAQITDWGSRLYILDPASDQIWRYPFVKSKSVFGTAEGYKTAGDLKNSVALTIDSSVYVLNNDGEILRFYGGVKQSQEVDRASFSTLTGPTRIYTDAEMSNLFVVDSAGARVFVYFKDPKTSNLIYTGQVIIDGVKDIRDVSYDKSLSRLYVLDSKRIYEVQL